MQLELGKYIAVWEEQGAAGRGWEYRRTMAATITIKGKTDKSIEAGKPVALTGNPRLHRGDDAFALPLGGKKNAAAWVTAGETNKQLTLHTVNEELKHKVTALNLP